jgi:MFS transporter, OPA family, sugar phosphate sensor protein UhpC
MLNRIFSKFKSAPEIERISDSEQIKKVYRHYRWQMFYSMYLGYVVFYFTRKNIAPALHIFSKEMNISMIELGIIGSVFYCTYGAGKFLSGCLADKTNIRYIFTFGLLAASATNLIFGTLCSVWVMAFVWGLNGAFQSMGAPPVAKGLVFWFSSSERATKWTIWSSSHTAGTFFIGIIVAFLLKYFGWQAAFYVPGIIGIAVSLFLFTKLKDTPVSVGLPPIEEYNNDPMPIKKEQGLTHWQTLKKYVFANPYLWYLSLANLFVYLIRFGTLDWGTIFMYEVRGIDPIKVAFLWSIMPLFGMPGGIVAGWVADKYFQGRCTQINLIYLALLALSILGFYIYAGMDHIILTCIFLGAIGFFVDGPQNLVSGVQVSRVTVQEAVATANGFAGMFGYVGAIVSGIGFAAVTEVFGWRGMYGACIAACVLAGFFVLLVWEKESNMLGRKKQTYLGEKVNAV